jgi:hypothetical protein
LTKGAKILRVHDVKEAMECVTLFNKINKNEILYSDCSFLFSCGNKEDVLLPKPL